MPSRVTAAYALHYNIKTVFALCNPRFTVIWQITQKNKNKLNTKIDTKARKAPLSRVFNKDPL